MGLAGVHAASILHARRLRARPHVAAFAVRMWASAVTVAVGPLVGAHLWLRRLRVKAERDALTSLSAPLGRVSVILARRPAGTASWSVPGG